MYSFVQKKSRKINAIQFNLVLSLSTLRGKISSLCVDGGDLQNKERVRSRRRRARAILGGSKTFQRAFV